MIPAFGHEPNCRFLGQPMSQNRYAIPAWSYFFELVKTDQIIEIGTSVGGFTTLLAIVAEMLDARLHSFDVGNTMSNETTDRLRRIAGGRATCCQLDVFSERGKAMVGDLIARGTNTVLLCDGGNKVKEVHAFAPLLKDGDVIAAHDYGGRPEWPWQEICWGEVAELFDRHGIVPWMPDVFATTGWMVCRKSNAPLNNIL